MNEFHFLIWFSSLICINSIYIPNYDGVNAKNLNNMGIKTLGWQENGNKIEMHHNYSKVGGFSQTHQQVNNQLDFSQSFNQNIYKSCPKGATGAFIYEDSCSQFLNCWKGRGSVQNCAPGTLFNPKTLECDYQEKVECVSGPNANNRFSRQILINTLNQNQIKQPSCPSGFSGIIPHYKICSKYIQCDHGNEIVMDCPAGTNFDSKTNRCDFPYKSECFNGDNQEDLKKKVVVRKYFDNVGFEFDGVRNDRGFSGVDNDGKKYFVVGKKVNDHLGEFENQNLNQNVNQHQNLNQNVNQNLNWNQNVNHNQNLNQNVNQNQNLNQNWNQNVNQNQNWNQNVVKNQEKNQNRVVKCPDGESGLFPHPFDCKKFLNCDHGKTFIQECGPGTVFNPKFKVCDWPYNVQCNHNQENDDQRTGKLIENNLEIKMLYGIDSETFCLGRNGFFENLKNCTVFFNCKNEKFSIGICHKGAQFNPYTKDCDDYYRCGSQNNQGNLNNQQGFNLNRLNQQQNSFNLNQKWNQQQNWNQNQNQQQSWNQNQNQQQIWYQNQNQNFNLDQKQVRNFDQNQNEDINFDQKPIKNQFFDQNQINYVDTSSKSILTTDTNADYIFDADDLVEVEPSDNFIIEKCDFKCPKTPKCLTQNQICNGIKDCLNGEDEINCSPSNLINEFDKIEKTKMAIKEIVKYPNTSVSFCAKKCIDQTQKCKSFNYRKNDGMCFILDTNLGETGSLFILPNYDYYEYKKFSVDCKEKFTCSNRKCIGKHEICDGKFDCVDKEDEKNCDNSKIGYSIQLIGSNKTNEGVIYVKAFNKAGFVCDDQFGLKDAEVVCKEIGFEGALDIKSNGFYRIPDEYKDDEYLMDDVQCSGNETSLKDCDFNGWGNHNCRAKEIVGVVCKSSEEFVCPIDKWKCETTNECIPLDFLCDNVDDCSDKSDEASQYCESPIEIKLSNGNRPSQGRLEIKYRGTWGTVCDDDFNDDAAKVVCRYLGFKGSATSRKNGIYGPGKGPIWLDQVFCQGNETTLQECDRWDWGKHNCDHSEDVGIDCDDQNVKSTPRNMQSKIKPPKQIFPATCGLRNDNIFMGQDDVHFRVVKGDIAEKGMYPWQANIRVKGQSSQEHWCGAVIISEMFVLTAGHCLNGYQKGGFAIVAGDYDRNEDEGTEQTVNIEEFYVHKDFRKGTKMNNDLALVKLKGDGFQFNDHIGPICLPPITLQEEGLNCSISGFGSVKSGRAVASRELRAGFIPVQTREVCKMPHIYGDALTEGMICAGSLGGGIDACDGDSGGPLACLNDGVFTLVGLTSWGQHCGHANKPGVYVKISYYRDWIEEMMKKHF